MVNRDVRPGKFLIRCLLTVAPLLLPAVTDAKNIYKYTDENGILHYTDKAPGETVEFETVYMEREPEPRISMRKEGTQESPVYIMFIKILSHRPQ